MTPSQPSNAIVPVLPNALARPLELDTSGLQTSYSNFIRVAGTFEELLIDFGFHSGIVMATPTGQTTTEPVKITNRVIMSFATAKRLFLGLQAAFAQHEQAQRTETREEK